MNKILFIWILTALGRVWAQNPVSAEQAVLLQQKLDSCVNAYSVPGISATLLLPGNRYWNGASGVADIYTEEPMNIDHVSYQASVSKMFTATIIFKLIEEGQLSLDDTVGKYLPPMQAIPSSTRIRYLLNQRSGMSDVLTSASTSNWISDPDSIWNSLDVIETYGSAPLFTQGSSFSYSNTNYILLGMIIEAITGQRFAEVLRERILIPYGLSHTFFPPDEDVVGTLTPGWTSFITANVYDTDAAVLLTDCFASMAYTAGSLVSYPQDVAKFNRMLLSGEVLSPSSLVTMKTCSNVSIGGGGNGYGHGLMRYIFLGKTYFGHAGDVSGFTQLSIHNESDSITLSLSINRNNAPRGPIALALLTTLKQAMTLDVPEEELNETSWNVFPNPAIDVVEINGQGIENMDLKLYNVMGELLPVVLLSHSPGTVVLDVTHLSNGCYFLQAGDQERNKPQKIMISK